jgi:hypothetical protein
MILNWIPALLVGCSITSGVAASRWLPVDSNFISGVLSRQSIPSAGSEVRRRDDSPVLETPAGPDSFCDNVPVDAWAEGDGAVYTAIAINSMHLCIQGGQFTEASNSQLHSALTSTTLAPRIDTMCREFYALRNAAYDLEAAQNCPPMMINFIEVNTLQNVSLVDR